MLHSTSLNIKQTRITTKIKFGPITDIDPVLVVCKTFCGMLFICTCFILGVDQTIFENNKMSTFKSDIYTAPSEKTTTVVHETDNSAELSEFMTKYLLYVIIGAICLVLFFLVIQQCKSTRSRKRINTRELHGIQDNREEAPMELQNNINTSYEIISETINKAHLYQTISDNYDEINACSTSYEYVK